MAMIVPLPRRWRRVALLLVTALAVSGCAPEDVAPTEPMALDGASLVLESVPPAGVACDPTKPFPVKIRWDVKDWPDPKFDIRLRSTLGQLPARVNEASGEMEFALAHEGLWILLVDRNSKLMVAAQPVPPLVCPSA